MCKGCMLAALGCGWISFPILPDKLPLIEPTDFFYQTLPLGVRLGLNCEDTLGLTY